MTYLHIYGFGAMTSIFGEYLVIDAPLDLVGPSPTCVLFLATFRAFEILAYRFVIFREVMAFTLLPSSGSCRLRERVRLSPAPEGAVKMYV